MDPNSELRTQLIKALSGKQAHLSFEEAIAEFPAEAINMQPPNMPYSFWHLIEHLRITQLDLLEYITKPDYVEGNWPNDYWPEPSATTDTAGWDQSIANFQADHATLAAIAQNPATDLFASVPSNSEHTIARCLLVVGNHNSYHIGELAILRQVTGTWGPKHI